MYTETPVKENVYPKLNEKIAEIGRLCRINKIPILITYVNPDTEQYTNEVVTPKTLDIELKNDKISKLNVALNNNFSIKINNKNPKDFAGDVIGSIIDEF